MQVQLDQVGKQYQKEWIIRHASHVFDSQSITGIRGSNGSGKSTLLALISSILTPTEGQIAYSEDQQIITLEQVNTKIAHVAPSIDLVPKLTVQETIDFHTYYSPLRHNWTQSNLLSTIWLEDFKILQIQELSSGMRQRLKLGLAFFTSADLLLLDEPTSNLDSRGINFYNQLLNNYRDNRTVIIASNEDRDFEKCGQIVDINQWKPST